MPPKYVLFYHTTGTNTMTATADAVVMQIRRDIAEACSKAADERGEPPLSEQG
jgi:hypothetical protein